MKNEDKNCKVTIERSMGTKKYTTVFVFDDYRVAIAVENILHNLDPRYFEAVEYTEEIR